MIKFDKTFLNYIAIYVFYFVVISIFYLEYPLNNQILGGVDAWANLAVFNDLLNWFENPIHPSFQNSFLFPTEHPWVLYGLDFFTGIIWIFYFKLGFSDLNAYWLYIVTLLALNSVALFHVSKQVLRKTSHAFILGLLFSVNSIIFSNIDNPNVLSYFFFFMSISALLSFSRNGKKHLLVIAAILCGFQIYASPVVFVFAVIFLLTYLLFTSLNKLLVLYPYTLISILIFCIIISPYIYWYVVEPLFCYSTLDLLGQQGEVFVDRYLSLEIIDFFRYWPFTEIHESFTPYKHELHPFISLKNVAIGLPIFALFLTSFWIKKIRRQYHWLYVVLIVYIVLGCSNYIIFNEKLSILNPMYQIFDFFHFNDFVRLASRFGLPIYLCFLYFGFLSLEHLASRGIINRRVSGMLVLFIIFSASNLPTYKASPHLNFLEVSSSISHHRDMFNEKDVILFLPTGLFAVEQDRREYVYMWINAKLKLRTLNGAAYCFPTSRKEMHKILDSERLNSENFCKFLIKHEVSKVITVNDFVMDVKEENQINSTFKASCLTKVKVFDNIEIYSLNK